MKKKYILFDFDGVIANTEERNKEYMEKALRIYGLSLTDEDKRLLIGTSDRSNLERILARSPVPISMEEFTATRRKVGNTYENGEIRPMPGLVSMLFRLRGLGIKTAVATSTSTRLIIVALDRMRMMSLFDAIVCGDMCTESKPHPEIYLRAMEYLGAAPSECIVIEDSTAGIHAGKRAGAYVIAYQGSGVKQDISEADFVVDTYEACEEKLIELLEI